MTGNESSFGPIAVVAVIALVVIVLLIRAYRARSSAPVDSGASAAAPASFSPTAIPQPAAAVAQPAPGSAGVIKLHSVPEKQAAMIMAIVADHLKTPLNQLRFKSIKRID